MVKLTIDNRTVEVAEGSTILDAARILGVKIPTMCFLAGFEPSTSCMVCVVRVNGSASLVPACATKVVEGMQVESETDAIHAARRTALELLLSDHAGDCMGPCQVGCPAEMEIPLMIRQIASGKMRDAIQTVKRDIPLPACLGRICPAPCEKVCRRRQKDSAVGICLLKRYVGDVDLQSPRPYLPRCASPIGKKVAVVGAGPAGLSAAYYLAVKGAAVTVYEQNARAGGGLLVDELKAKLPPEVVEAEVRTLVATGFQVVYSTRVGRDISWTDVVDSSDAVFLAMGTIDPEDAERIGVAVKSQSVAVDKTTYQSSISKIFAGGNAAGPKRRLAVRAVADGKEAAESILQFLTAGKTSGPKARFNSRMGKLSDDDMARFAAEADPAARVMPADMQIGFSTDEAIAESRRCLHCDCRKADACRLRILGESHGASIAAYDSPKRPFERDLSHPEIIFESGKCIDCGLCIQTARKHLEPLGLAFVGRGFNVRVRVPFGKSIAEGLHSAARECAANCPTGAICLVE